MPAHVYRITRHLPDGDRWPTYTVAVKLGDRWEPLQGEYGPTEQDTGWYAAKAILTHVAGGSAWDRWALWLGPAFEHGMTSHTLDVSAERVTRFVREFDPDVWINERAQQRGALQAVAALAGITVAAGVFSLIPQAHANADLARMVFQIGLLVTLGAAVVEWVRLLLRPRQIDQYCSRRGPAWVWQAIRGS